MPAIVDSVVLLADDLDSAEGRAALTLAGRLSNRGFRPTLIVSAGEAAPMAGVEIVRRPGLARRWGWSISARRIAAPRGTSLIHAIGSSMARVALELAERWQTPYLVTIDGFFVEGAVLRLGGRRCRGLIATGPEVAQELRIGLGVPEPLISEIPFGVERPERTNRLRDLASVRVVGAAASLVSGSGLSTFLQAAKKVSEARRAVEFVVAGDGPAESDLRRLASRLGISSSLTFADDPSRGRPFWGVLDVFCQPSVIPNGGRTLATAMGFGIPSIASEVPGLNPWIAAGSCARGVPPGDSDALASAILDLLADPWTASELGRRGRDRVAALADPDREADLLAGLYRRVIAEAPAPAAIRLDQGAATSTRAPNAPAASSFSRSRRS